MNGKDIPKKMLDQDPFSSWLGIEILESGLGRCKVALTIRKDMLNSMGKAHGGISGEAVLAVRISTGVTVQSARIRAKSIPLGPLAIEDLSPQLGRLRDGIEARSDEGGTRKTPRSARHPREQAKALGVYGFVASAGGSIGLLAGGVLTDAINWHWIFFINVPIGIAALVITSMALKMPVVRRDHKIDYLGAAVIVGYSLNRVMGGMARHPNIGAYVLIGLGCETGTMGTLLQEQQLVQVFLGLDDVLRRRRQHDTPPAGGLADSGAGARRL